MDIDAPGPSKSAKPTRTSTAGSVRVASSAPPSPTFSPIDLATVAPRPRIRARIRAIDPVVPTASLPIPLHPIDNPDELLLAIRNVRNTVSANVADINMRITSFSSEMNSALDLLEDKVRAARSRP